jgi:flavin reductase (DIM6/NTAB) family NADH-FMN oxidoreductase RutF
MALSDVRALEAVLDRTLWVVTSRDGPNTGGLVATFVNTASIVREMPRVVVGIAKQHRTRGLIEASGAFALHLVGGEHLDLVSRFGLESGRSVDKLAGLEHRTGPSGSPILLAARGWLDCRVEDRLDTGDRTIYLAEVLDARAPGSPDVLTLRGWAARLSPELRARLIEQLDKDAAVDAVAIRAWRRARIEKNGGNVD